MGGASNPANQKNNPEKTTRPIGDKRKTRMATACPTGLCETPGAQGGLKMATSGSNAGENVKLER